MDDIGRGEGANLLAVAARHAQLGQQLVARRDALVERGVDAFALDGVGEADHGRLGHVGMEHDGRLDLGGADAVARRVDDVVDPSGDPDVPVLVAPRAVARQVVALPVGALNREVGRHVALVVAEDVTNGRRPGALDGKEALGGALLLDALGRE